MKIPTIIHQTWKDENIPAEFMPFIQSWKLHHPDWQFILWTDEMNRNFVVENYPNFLSVYDSYSHNIQRADAIRYLILQKLGGVYIDLDFECLTNIKPLLQKGLCIFGKEPLLHCQSHRKEKIVCNAFMATEPNTSFFNAIIQQLFANQKLSIQNKNNEVVETTGPFMLTDLYDNYAFKNEITLLESHTIYPLTKIETIALYANAKKEKHKQSLLANGAFAIHYFWGTWWRKQNPFQS